MGRGAWRAVLVPGVTLGAMNLLFYLALSRIPVAVAVTLEQIGPLVLALAQSRKLVDFAWVCLAGLGVAVIGAQSVSVSRVRLRRYEWLSLGPPRVDRGLRTSR